MIPWEVNLLKLCFIVHHNFHKRLCKAFREKFAPLKKKQFCRFWKRVCTYLFHSSFRCSVLKNRDGGEQQTLYTCWLMPSEFAHFSFCVCVCLQLVMRTKPGPLEERICPWARYVTRPKDVPIFEQVFWDPPQEQVCWSCHFDFFFFLFFCLQQYSWGWGLVSVCTSRHAQCSFLTQTAIVFVQSNVDGGWLMFVRDDMNYFLKYLILMIPAAFSQGFCLAKINNSD